MKTLTLIPGAFNAELLTIIGTNKIGWGGEDHLNLFASLKTKLKDEAGEPAKFNEQQADRLNLVFRPNEEIQRKVLKDTLTEAGYILAPTTADVFALLLSVAQFADFLAKTVNPKTGKPFIAREKKRGAKKDTFASLIAAPETPAPQTNVTSTGAAQAEATGAPAEGEAMDTEGDVSKTPAAKSVTAGEPTPRK